VKENKTISPIKSGTALDGRNLETATKYTAVVWSKWESTRRLSLSYIYFSCISQRFPRCSI